MWVFGSRCPNWELIPTSILRSDLKSKKLIVDVLKLFAHTETSFASTLVLTETTLSPGVRLDKANSNETLTLYVDRIYNYVCSKSVVSATECQGTSLIGICKYLVVPIAMLGIKLFSLIKIHWSYFIWKSAC